MDRNSIIKKWSEASGKVSVAGIEDVNVRENLAILLENQETKNIKSELLNEDFTTSTPTSEETGQFRPLALALVRRTFPELFANKVLPVQAMNGPVGLAYALRFIYATPSEGVADGNEAAFNLVDKYSGYTGSQSGTSGSADSGTGVALDIAEAWKLGTQYPQLKLILAKTAVEAKTRKLGASFSLEAAQDIRAMHGLDIEREILNVLQYEVTAEYDREVVARLKAVAVDATKGGAAADTVDISATDGRWSQERFGNLVNTIVKKANDIAIYTRRGAGNFVIVSPRVATALQAAGHQFFTSLEAKVNATGTMAAIGTINGVIDVYRDSYASSDYALVGYKGPGVSDGGVIYSPYITGLVARATDPNDFSPRIGVMSRYALTDSLLGA
ncbi:MAG: hypothetical protein QXG00_06600, partial [Candidatus Woesearchaeota archaeon]